MESSTQDLLLRTHILEQALSQLGQGIVLLNKARKIVFSTQVANDMIAKKDGLDLVQDQIVAINTADQQRFNALLDEVCLMDKTCNTHKTLYLHRTQGLRPYWLLASKVQLSLDKTENHGILLIIKDTHANTIYWLERLKSNYQLTNREADFAILLAEGRSIQEISVVMDIVEDTARQYLKSCFKKMDVQKQHEMVRLALDWSRKRWVMKKHDKFIAIDATTDL